MMKKKTITTLLATVLVLFLVVAPSTVAAAGGYTIRLADTSGNSIVSADAGDTVTLVLSIENNPGITGVGVKVNYPAGVSLVAQPKDVSNFGSVANVNRVFSQNTTDDPYVMWWNMALGDSNKKLVVKEGNLAELTFKVADNAADGDYKITLTAPADMNRTANVDSKEKIIDDSIVPINPIVVNCTIRVGCDHSWSSWTNKPGAAADCNNPGRQTRQCSECFKIQERTTSALGHSYKNGSCTRCSYTPTPVKITKQPANSTAANGKTASVTVKATGDGLTYTWYIKSANGSSFTKSSVKSATYATKMSTSVHGRHLYCVVKDQYGNSVKTNTVRLKGTPVKITTQPANSTAAEGKTVKTTVKATGDGLTYTWYYKNSGASSYKKSSITSATYSAKMSTAVNGRKVYCVVKDQYGYSVTTNTVTLKATPVKITTQPVSVTVASGKTASVTVNATGDGLTYKWYYKNKGASKFSLTKSFTGASYSLKMNASRSGRQVYCVITDKYGNTVTTKTVTLRMKATITKQPVSVVVANGKTAKVTVSAAGEGLTYKWYYKNKGASKFSLTKSFTGASYSLKMNASRSGRQVYCVITDKYGNTVTTKTVTLSMKATITKQPTNVTVAGGKTAKVTVSAAGEGLTYKWYYKNKGATKFSLSSVKSKTYTVAMTAARNGRQVYCKVTDKFGNTVKSNTVTLKMK